MFVLGRAHELLGSSWFIEKNADASQCTEFTGRLRDADCDGSDLFHASNGGRLVGHEAS